MTSTPAPASGSAWRDDGGRLVRVVEAASFTAAAELALRVAQVADGLDHHPELMIAYPGRLTITTWSHDVGGVTARDHRLAEAVEPFLAGAGTGVAASVAGASGVGSVRPGHIGIAAEAGSGSAYAGPGELVRAEFHQFYLVGGDVTAYEFPFVDPLAEAGNNAVVVLTSLARGPVAVETVALTHAPGELDEGVLADGWECAQEVSVESYDGLRLTDGVEGGPVRAPFVTGSGVFRVRILATGREGYDREAAPGEEVVERYRVEAWPDDEVRDVLWVGDRTPWTDSDD